MENRIPDETADAQEILRYVFDALASKGFDPVLQLVGYFTTGDPTYITAHRNARTVIRRIERDELLEEVMRFYVEHNDEINAGKTIE